MSGVVDRADVEALQEPDQPELTEAREVVDVELPDPEPSVEVAVPEQITPDHVPAGMDLAIVPPEQEMRALVQLAVTLSAADLVPKALRQKPNDVLLVLLTARDLGIKLTTALRLCYPIDGQVTVAPKLKLAIIRERKIARVWPHPDNDEHGATWYAVRADDPETTFQSTFTWEDAQRPTGKARLLDQRCSPGEHVRDCKCKDNWRSWPARMLSWRALGFLMDDACGEVGSGLYSPDELGAMTDDEGTVVLDVTEVGPLDGTQGPRSMRRDTAPPPLADEQTRDLLARMLRALPEDGVTAAHVLWPTAVGVKIHELPERKVKAARAVADSMWKRAAAGEWGDWSPPFDPDEPLSAPESDPDPGSGDGAPEAAETLSGAQSPESGPAEGTPELTDIEEVIDWCKELDPGDVRQRCAALKIAPEGEDRSDDDWRRELAVRTAADLGLL